MSKVKWGVIGAGGIADRRTIPGMMLAKNAELVAVMEVNKELAEKIRAKYNAKRAYDNVDDLLADEEVQAVYIASPVIYHKEQVIKAANAKKHILVEKPVAFSVEDGKELVELCKKNNVLIATGFMMRFHAYHQEMKKLVSEGKLGQIVSCRAQLTCWYPDIPGAWRQQFATSGGGAMMDMGVHCLDLIQYIVGSKAKKVVGFTDTKTFKYEVEDSASVIVQLENGANVYIDAYFNIPDAAAKGRMEIYGTKGSILAEGTIGQVEGGKVEVVISDDTLGYDAQQNRVDVKPIELNVTLGNMYTKEIESFSNSILNGTPLEVPAEDGIQIQEVVEKAYESSKTGKVMEL
ncbi:MAG: Gfo/Idh/MocA family oxidoreductase [Clostridiaceae bacterium]|jgi:predicted dehydrogenase|nr:Gfo/Idh/MocA family oxidoreductase [Clostridiaceae bacterium]